MNSRNDPLDRKALGILYLAGSLGHELNNQLTVIFGSCATLKRQDVQGSAHERLEAAAGHIADKIGGLTRLAGRLGAARRSIVLQEELEQAVASLDNTSLPPLDTDLNALGDVRVRMDPSILPLALSFSLDTFDSETRVSLAGHKTGNGDARLTLRGNASHLSPELLSAASSSNPELILGDTTQALGLAVVKAFAHRCGGQISWTRRSHELEATLDLPRILNVNSFLSE